MIPQNEPVRQYAPGSAERKSLEASLARQAKERIEIPCIIGGKRILTGQVEKVVMPHDHGHVLAEVHCAGRKEIEQAIAACLSAKREWERLSPKDRMAVFLRAADMIAGSDRDLLNGATMLGQSKNAYQAEIDSACELIDFLRFNAYFYEKILTEQPISPPQTRNQTEQRPLEGFVTAITPFNFTAIAGNLPSAPAMLGNTVLWKPSTTQMLSAYYTMDIFEKAGLPPGVINFVGAAGPLLGEVAFSSKDLAGVHFTGSTRTFQHIFRTIGGGIENYRTYPRLVGETGGKDFVFAHVSADPEALAVALLRGAFEYQGQKCSAASRAYIPKSLWKQVRDRLVDDLKTVKLGDVRDFSCFMNAVIDDKSYANIMKYIEYAQAKPQEAKILSGGKGDRSRGYFIEPTVIEVTQPKFKTMEEEIFGPVLSVFVYDDSKEQETLSILDQTSPYALTGAIFAQDRRAIVRLTQELRHSAGNFYINDKPTGAVVGQQPFGGARASGTNDKAGSALNLYRWLSPRTLKESFLPPKDYRYPFLDS